MRRRLSVVVPAAAVVDHLHLSSVCCWVVVYLNDEEDLKMHSDAAEQAVDWWSSSVTDLETTAQMYSVFGRHVVCNLLFRLCS